MFLRAVNIFNNNGGATLKLYENKAYIVPNDA